MSLSKTDELEEAVNATLFVLQCLTEKTKEVDYFFYKEVSGIQENLITVWNKFYKEQTDERS